MISEIFNEREVRAKTECYELVKFRDRARMLTFIMRDDSRYSASYGHLYTARYLGHSIRIEFSQNTVVVQGAHLAPLHYALTDHRVVYLRELPAGAERVAGESLIDRISLLELSSDVTEADENETRH